MITVGLVSPGQMGASIGAAVQAPDTTVIWAGDGRSPSSHQRANRAGINDYGTMAELVLASDIILSICPPHDAEPVAQEIRTLSFQGLYADCNAIAPHKSRQISSLFGAQNFVDGSIIGGPAWQEESGTHLYLSGERSIEVAGLFSGSPLQTSVISDEVGAASALKMVFAAYSKGTTALLSSILAVAEQEGVRALLEDRWGASFTEQTHEQVRGNSAKAWRFSGEMREIAATFEEAGQPGGFHLAAADVFERLETFKDNPATDLDALLDLLKQPTPGQSD